MNRFAVRFVALCNGWNGQNGTWGGRRNNAPWGTPFRRFLVPVRKGFLTAHAEIMVVLCYLLGSAFVIDY